MSTTAILISSIVTASVFTIIDFVMRNKENSGNDISYKKHFLVEWVSSFVLFLLVDVVLMLCGEQIGLWDFVASVFLAMVFALLSLLWRVLKKAMNNYKASEND